MHDANGVAELAMKHRDSAEARLNEVIGQLENAEADRDKNAEFIRYIAPALLVLRNMCATAGLIAGEAKANEMIAELRERFPFFATTPPAGEKP